jgi:hypothetical protein
VVLHIDGISLSASRLLDEGATEHRCCRDKKRNSRVCW